jgi:2-polyprenyl-3-methyl-5-hydroxy-6-metoxy-1,4-benzoquinol methylase
MAVSNADADIRYVPEEQDTNTRCAIMHRSRYEWLLGLVDVPRASILDFGCGSGYGAEFLAENGGRVMGIDISPSSIAYAKTKFPRVSFLEYDLTDRNLTKVVSQRFDLIVSFDVIEHVEKWWAFFENIRELLKRGGTAIVGCPNRVSHFDFNPLWNKFHVQEFTPAQLEWIARTQFDDVTVLGQRFSDPEARMRNTARPLSAAHHLKEALLQTPFRTPVRKLVERLHGDGGQRSVRTHGTEDARRPSEIVFEKIDMSDASALSDPFGVIAVCRT